MSEDKEGITEPGPKRNNRRSRRIMRRRLLLSSAIVVLLIGAGAAAYLFTHRQVSNNWNDVTYVVGRISQHFLLPTDETPALLTVTDSTKLTSTFLKQAQDGDKIVIYQTNQKAIIYRPSIDRIIAVGPVVIDDVSSMSQ